MSHEMPKHSSSSDFGRLFIDLTHPATTQVLANIPPGVVVSRDIVTFSSEAGTE